MISKESVGVEISNNHLTIVHVKATPFDTKICAQEFYELDATSGFVEKMETIHAMVRDFLRQHHIGSACLWIGLPAEMVIQRVIRLPSAAKENLAKALEYELPKYIPLAPEDVYFRYQILNEDRDEKQLTILLAAVKKKNLAPLIELRNNLGTGICGVESTATAGINGLKWASKSISEKAYALAYVVDTTLHLGYFENEQLRFIGTLELDDDLMNQSERLLQEFDYKGTTGTESDSTDALAVYCHGPGATKDMLQVLNELPNLEFSLLDLSQGPFEEKNSIASTGLALKSLQSVAVDINLFPEHFRKKPSIIGRYIILALFVLTLITGMGWVGSHIVHQRVTGIRVDRELNELSDKINALEQANSEITALQERIDYLGNLQKDRIGALEFLKELTEILPETAWLSRLSVADNKVEIQGYTDYSTRLITQLEASPLFANAKFISTITKDRDGKQVFKIGFEINRQ
ncbi:MAG: pilus assembly protein PilM [Desulfobacteraceae bacterium]|nr:pilus assembly protein PilM [Desulfobacteraceae bacterium]